MRMARIGDLARWDDLKLAAELFSANQWAKARPLTYELPAIAGLPQRHIGYIYDGLLHPTLPSSETAISFCASTANSIGNCCSTSRTKPLTMSAVASSAESPRCMQ